MQLNGRPRLGSLKGGLNVALWVSALSPNLAPLARDQCVDELIFCR